MLTAKDRKRLKSEAHHLEPVVRIGKNVLTEGLVDETNRTLEAHELIKIRIDSDDRETRRSLAAELAERCGAALVDSIGKISILYRPNEEE
ncbi:MAG: ribosome assembly RNA-binding protein YhbY [Acidobacteria bacterium]|nr:ribosome assembly RNA-binding protein YhbY [Acidobacteriota bacterium]